MSVTTIMVQRWLKELPNPDSKLGRQARDELIEHGSRRMEALCRKMFFKSLQGTPIDYEDVFQESAIRLWKSLQNVQPTTVREFFGLAATQIRRVLVDLCRKYVRAPPDLGADVREASFNPAVLAKWTEFHEQVEKLDEPLRDVVELLWYHDLTQVETAEILGIDQSTVRRRWRRAREMLAEFVL